MIHVIATIRVKPGKRDEMLAQFRELTPKVHAEEGCIESGPTIDVETEFPPQQRVGDDAVVVVEKWTSVVALEAHLMAPHMMEYRLAVKDIVTDISLLVLRPA